MPRTFTPRLHLQMSAVDWLMSLTLADKLQAELGVPVKASLFLECATVGELESWVMKQSS